MHLGAASIRFARLFDNVDHDVEYDYKTKQDSPNERRLLEEDLFSQIVRLVAQIEEVRAFLIIVAFFVAWPREYQVGNQERFVGFDNVWHEPGRH